MLRLWRSSAHPAPTDPFPTHAREVFLKSRPPGPLEPDTFALRTVALPPADALPPDAVAVRVLFVSADPAMRGWIRSRSYVKPVGLGERMRALAVGRVVAAAPGVSSPRVGDLVEGVLGWTSFAVVPHAHLTRVAPLPPPLGPSAVLGVLGITGLTALFGLEAVGRVRRGDVVVVSGAAGATGGVVVQLARRVFGAARVVGVAGGAAKCAHIVDELGAHATVDYKADDGVDAGLAKALGGRRIDVFFDNVGGAVLEAALRRLNYGARVVVCGAISGYNEAKLPPGPRNYVALIPAHASMAGFLLHDFKDRFDEARRRMARWITAGKVRVVEDVVDGLERAPEALQRLFDGKNVGKVVVRVDAKQQRERGQADQQGDTDEEQQRRARL